MGKGGIARLSEIDLMRSLAIVIMIYANSFPYAADFEPHPMLRLLMSLAAPLFIFLSGFTSTLAHGYKRANFLTALALFCSACFVDTIVWEIIPFYTFDVLYCIATAALINSLVHYTDLRIYALMGLTIIVYLSIHYYLPYDTEIQELQLSEFHNFRLSDLQSQALTNGWFPFFPWIAFSFLGRYYGMNRSRIDTMLEKTKPLYLLLLPLTAFMAFGDAQSAMRMGYIEVFYPPSLPYLLMAAVWIASLLSLNKVFSRIPADSYFLVIGKSSLLIYILHSIINHYILESLDMNLEVVPYSMLIVFFVMLFSAVAILHQSFRKHQFIKSWPLFFRKIFGF